MRKRIAVLGSTGSIGVNALHVLASLKNIFEVVALSADSNIGALELQAKKHSPKVICVRDSSLAKKFQGRIPSRIIVLNGAGGLEEIASRSDVDMVLFAISGSSCLLPLVSAIKHGKKVALANKEALVSGGSVVMPLAKKHKVNIIPIDSEHSAIFQCLEGKREFLKKIYLTATGGPLLDVPVSRFDRLSRKSILNHPRWKMGDKISIDSATMMNKGLEIIEARWLFDTEEKKIDVLVHPEAVIHSMIELIDGTVFAELSVADMRIPIQYAVTYPDRHAAKAKPIDFLKIKKLSFREPDHGKFPCLLLAREALKDGGTYPAVLNAADEEAVKMYLDGSIKFSQIPELIEKALQKHRETRKEPGIGEILEAESWAREEIVKLCH